MTVFWNVDSAGKDGSTKTHHHQGFTQTRFGGGEHEQEEENEVGSI